MKRNGYGRYRQISAAAVLLVAGMCLAGCGKSEKSPGTPEITTIQLDADTMVQKLEDGTEKTLSGVSSSLPSFTTSTGIPMEGMADLNEIIDSVGKDYEVDLSSDRKLMMIHTDTQTSEKYLQTTFYQTEYTTTLTGRVQIHRNLYSLAYSIEEDLPVTAVEALDSTGITGIALSQYVKDDFSSMKEQGELSSTEMQGFLLDENGEVVKIYMKLEIDRGEEDYTELFYCFNPENKALTALDWPGDQQEADVPDPG